VIEIATVNRNTEVSDYWDKKYYETKTFTCNVVDVERTSHIVKGLGIENIMFECEADRFIIDHSPDTMYDYPDSNVRIEVYDGYNE